MRVDIADVRGALDNDELVPCFQPVVELHTGRLSGFEVLARWQHPQLGLVLPENFISLAEENGMVGLLMQQIMRKAFLSAPVLPEPLILAVNVSPSQLRDLSLPAQIRDAAEKAAFPLNRLTVEITESGILDNLERALKITRGLKAIGCRLGLDDFGTGYSSLSHLQSLPFDALKIDRSFVSAMTDTRESRKIVAAIVGLAHSLDMITVAEGIETEEQAEMLLSLGAEFGQGWFYGRPWTADRIPEMLAAAPRKLSTALSLHGGNWVVSSLEAMPAQRLAQLQAIYDGAPVGLCFLDCKMRYVSINRQLAAMNGSPVSAYLGRTVQEMIPKVFPAIEPFLRRALNGEAIQKVEFIRPANGTEMSDATNLVSYQPALDEAGEVIGISVMVVDITDRKRTEEALRASEDHLRLMVEMIPEIPWVMDAEGNNLDFNSRWTEITGLNREQTRNLGWLEALHPEDVEPTMKAIADALHTGKPIDIEYRVKCINGGWKWMRSRGSPRVGPSGQIVRWYGSLEDIDDRKLLQEELRKFRM
ncbi:MAG: EAL domain-containing protein [Terracidiphilus sp.]|nr:EAL domain-containing protein [Terracidiphilus sp.]